MPVNLIIQIPDSLDKYRPHLQQFFVGMVAKLHKNAHKDTPNIATIVEIIELLYEEVDELTDQIAKDKYNENSLIESMDISNFAFLIYVALRLQGVEHEPK